MTSFISIVCLSHLQSNVFQKVFLCHQSEADLLSQIKPSIQPIVCNCIQQHLMRMCFSSLNPPRPIYTFNQLLHSFSIEMIDPFPGQASLLSEVQPRSKFNNWFFCNRGESTYCEQIHVCSVIQSSLLLEGILNQPRY